MEFLKIQSAFFFFDVDFIVPDNCRWHTTWHRERKGCTFGFFRRSGFFLFADTNGCSPEVADTDQIRGFDTVKLLISDTNIGLLHKEHPDSFLVLRVVVCLLFNQVPTCVRARCVLHESDQEQ